MISLRRTFIFKEGNVLVIEFKHWPGYITSGRKNSDRENAVEALARLGVLVGGVKLFPGEAMNPARIYEQRMLRHLRDFVIDMTKYDPNKTIAMVTTRTGLPEPKIVLVYVRGLHKANGDGIDRNHMIRQIGEEVLQFLPKGWHVHVEPRRNADPSAGVYQSWKKKLEEG